MLYVILHLDLHLTVFIGSDLNSSVQGAICLFCSGTSREVTAVNVIYLVFFFMLWSTYLEGTFKDQHTNICFKLIEQWALLSEKQSVQSRHSSGVRSRSHSLAETKTIYSKSIWVKNIHQETIWGWGDRACWLIGDIL